MNGLIEWAIFLALSGVAVFTAAGMILTMSMYRAGLALMTSFVALAGLFVLLDADLLAAIQIMMNVGGMLVMVLFMVMFMLDPGGEMMWDMKRKMHLPGPGAFSMAMPRGAPPPEPGAQNAGRATDHVPEKAGDWTCPMHPEVSEDGPGSCPICGMALVPRAKAEDSISTESSLSTYTCPMHSEVRQAEPGECPLCGMDLIPSSSGGGSGADHSAHHVAAELNPLSGGSVSATDHRSHSGHAAHDVQAAPAVPSPPDHSAHGDHSTHVDHSAHSDHSAPSDRSTPNDHSVHGETTSMTPRQHYQMMLDMAMSTAQLPWALALGVISAVALVLLAILTPWPAPAVAPRGDAVVAVGELLLSRYMIGFEGAAFLILAGIAGAVILARPDPGPARETSAPAPSTDTYSCPMHPRVRQAGPGECPICGMDLIPAASEAGAGREHAGHGGGG